MLAKILVVEDNTDQAELTSTQLQQAGYQVRVAHKGKEGIRIAAEWQPDIIILDVMLPDMTGWDVCKQIRRISDASIIFVTVLAQEKNVIHGLTLGGDDYLIKPYEARELVARVKAMLRRRLLQTPPPSGVFVYGDLHIDFDRRRVTRGDTIINLSPKEFKLLSQLATSPGRSLPHRQLLYWVWGNENQSLNLLKLYICYLRRKLEQNPSRPQVILTDHGVGYRLKPPDRIIASQPD